MEGAPKGVLRVSLPVAFARLHVAPAITEFLRLYPGITLDLSLTDDVVNLVDDRLDLAVRIGSLESSSLISRKLAPHRRVVYGSPDYLAEHGEPHSPADLGRHNCLPISYNTGGRVWRFSGKSEETVRVTGNLRANNSETLREAAIGGAGLILMPTWLVGADIEGGSAHISTIRSSGTAMERPERVDTCETPIGTRRRTAGPAALGLPASIRRDSNNPHPGGRSLAQARAWSIQLIGSPFRLA